MYYIPICFIIALAVRIQYFPLMQPFVGAADICPREVLHTKQTNGSRNSWVLEVAQNSANALPYLEHLHSNWTSCQQLFQTHYGNLHF